MKPARSRWPSALVLGLIPLLVGGIYSLWQLLHANERVEHTYEVRLTLAQLLATLVDAETGVRGYALTGEPQFLQPYDRAQASLPALISRARALTSDNSAQQDRLAKFEALVAHRVELLGKMRVDYDARGRGADLTPSMLEGKSQMDTLRSLIAELQNEENRLDRILQREAAIRWQTTLYLFAGSAIVVLIAAAVGRRSRYNAEKNQRAAEEHFRLMVESVKDYAIITLDKDGRVTSWNRGAQAIKGYRADEIIGQHFSRFYLEEEARSGKCDRELEQAAREGRFEEEGWRVRKDGSRFWASVVINAVRDDRGELVGFAKVTRDLTERKLAAEALADEYRRRTDAERESRFAQMFIGILGHDLRNPLNAIAMAARLLSKKGEADAKVIERIASSARRMSNMVDQLLDLTRSRLAGGIPIEKKGTDLCAIISGVVDELRLGYPDRQIRWTPQAHKPHCAFDPDRMAQVVSNLIGNAIQHSEASTPVTVRLTVEGHEVVFSVHNEGPPIPAELLPHVFEPYRRNTVRSERSKGLGLGLFITQQVVHSHGGKIDIRSTAADGTTFIVTLPCTRPTSVAPTTEV